MRDEEKKRKERKQTKTLLVKFINGECCMPFCALRVHVHTTCLHCRSTFMLLLLHTFDLHGILL